MRHLLSCAIVLATSTAVAAPVIQVRVVPAAKGNAPTVEVTVTGAADLPIDKFALVESTATTKLVATAKRDLKSSEPLALALVMQTSEIWLGNDDFEPEDSPARYVGALKPFAKGLDASPLAKHAPAGSKALLVTYADKAAVKISLGPLEKLTGKSLGRQQDYKGSNGTEMVKGLALAVAELHKATASRKLVIVVGDGNDTNVDKVKAELAKLATQAADDHVQLFAVLYKGELSDPASAIASIVPDASTASQAKDIATAANARLDQHGYVLVFPGRAGFPFDGKPHDLVLAIDKATSAPVSVVLPAWTAPKP